MNVYIDHELLLDPQMKLLYKYYFTGNRSVDKSQVVAP